MAIETHVHDGSAYRKAKQIYAHDGSGWRDIKEAWCHDGTEWRKVFSKGYWQLVGSSRADVPTGWSIVDYAMYGGEIYILARESVYYGFVGAGLYKWDAANSKWALQGGSLSINAAVHPRIFTHTDGIHYFAVNGSNAWTHDLWNGAWSSLTTPYFAPVAAVSLGGTLYIAKDYDNYGECIKYWNGSSWVTMGSDVYESRNMTSFDGTLFITGNPVGVGAYWDWVVMRWSGTAWVSVTFPGSYIETDMLVGDSNTVWGHDNNGIMYYNGSAFVYPAGSPTLGSYNYTYSNYAVADGCAVLPIYDGYSDYFGRMVSYAAKAFPKTPVNPNYYQAEFYDAAILYVVGYNGGGTDPVYVYKWVGDLPT